MCSQESFIRISIFQTRAIPLVLPADNFPPSNDKKAAAIKIVNTFQDQIKKNGSDARIKMFGDIPFATAYSGLGYSDKK
jgi:hypothetical protein